ESCHGPGETHSLLAKKNGLSTDNNGFSFDSSKPLNWHFEKGDPIANPVGSKNSDSVDMCGDCHSLRTKLTDTPNGQDYHDNNRLQLLSDASYFADGQIREEVFVLGSFLQSKMFEQGVTCNNCHNPHSGKVLIEGNGLCAQCHRSETYDTQEHHHHESNSDGAMCVNCHMPARTFMQVDDRRDHSFTIPRPGLSSALQVPNACVDCHNKNEELYKAAKKTELRDNRWATKVLELWGVKSEVELDGGHWSHLNHRAQSGDILVTRPLIKAIEDQTLGDLIRASMLQQLAVIPSRVGSTAAQLSLVDKSPLVRRGAVMALQGLAPSTRWQFLSPYMKDGSRSVRFQVAQALAGVLNQLPVDQRADLARLIVEYRGFLELSQDAPATQVAIANLELNLGNIKEAVSAFNRALFIEPYYIPALINLADLHRSSGDEAKTQPLLEKALSFAPDSGAVQHSYGLFLIRNKDYSGALRHLKIAFEQSDAQPRYAYVYAVALENQGRIDEAVKTLLAANDLWPNQYELLMTLVIYLEKTGNISALYPYLSTLTAIAPSAPDVKRLVNKYAR
ncbi:MAG: tetratricopeptide (TPR) repeat protein, partial [Gammaproteobacteria bacterium]